MEIYSTCFFRKWKHTLLFIGGLFILGNFAQEFDVCKGNAHLTDLAFTCCGKVRYDSPDIYRSKEYAEKCLQRPGTGPIILTSWAAFKCLIDKAMGTFDPNKMPEILASKLPSNVKNSIEETFKTLIARENPYTGNANLEGYENYVNAWDAYYMAENQACIKEVKGSYSVSRNNERCYSWIEQTTRRGDCCGGVPIPFELYPDPLVFQYFALKNYTAYHLLNIVGEFDWKNASVVQFSDHVATCRRLTLFILQEKTTLEQLKKDITGQVAPNYTTVSNMIIPPYMSQDVTDKITEMMFNDTEIRNEYDIRNMMNDQQSMYQYVYADDWVGNTYNQNATRYLFWHCHANFILNSRYKTLDISPFCLS